MGDPPHNIRRTVQSVPLLQEVISYAFTQYCLKIGEIAYLKIVTYIIKMNQLLLTLEHFLVLLILALVRPTRRGSGGRMPLSSITPTVHHTAALSMPAIKVSNIN
jgi:hypothetical protein